MIDSMKTRPEITAVIVLATLLAACSAKPPAEALLDDYLTRLSRVLDVPRPESSTLSARETPLPRLPAQRELAVEIQPLSINLLDLWGFRQCELAEVLGERNSVLGRVLVPSQHLHMDGRILLALRACQHIVEDEELLALTVELERGKQQQWPQRYWNATVAAPELRQFWSPSSSPLVPGEEASYQRAEAAMDFLAALPQQLAEGRWPERAELEAHYQALDLYSLGGRLLHSLRLGQSAIAEANYLLQEAIEQRRLCPAGLQKVELKYARNVMAKVFAGEVQPWLAAINRRASTLLPRYQRLIDQQPTDLQARITPFNHQVSRLHQDFQQTLRDHVAHWQTLFDTCGSQAIPDQGR